jgi:tRNA U38,U39,U40 pseudouridine synthase TruA
LAVGDGDLSYSLALVRCFGRAVEVIASTLCTHDELTGTYTNTPAIVSELEKAGARVAFRVDATDLAASQLPLQDHIIFNHPHLGLAGLDRTEEHARRHTALIGHFLSSALTVLAPNGLIHLTLCGNQRQAWCVDEHARRLGLVLVDARHVGAPALYGIVKAEEKPPKGGWQARRRFRDGSLGSRHALSAYGYEHRRTEGEGDVRSDRSVELVLARVGEAPRQCDERVPARVTTDGETDSPDGAAGTAASATDEPGCRCSVCGLSFPDSHSLAGHVFQLSRPDVWGRPIPGRMPVAASCQGETPPLSGACGAALACAVCHVAFPSRNKLFAHLRAGCGTSAVDGAPSTKRHRLSLLAGYVGGSSLDFQAIEEALLEASRRAWGLDAGVSVAAPVQTERGAHALSNCFVLSVRTAESSLKCSGAALRAALLSSMWLLSDPVAVAAGSPLDELRCAVRRQTYRYAVPYSVLGAHHWTARHSKLTPCQHPERQVFLTSLPDPFTPDDLAQLLAETELRPVHSRLAECGGFAELEFPSTDEAARACSVLDGLACRGSHLLALPLQEAAAKLEVHRRLKGPFRRLSGDRKGRTRSYAAFASDRWRKRNAHDLRMAVSCRSSLGSDLRGGTPCGGGGGESAWQRRDWVVLELGAAEFGAQQVRRIVGAIVQAMRLDCSDEARIASIERYFATDGAPLAPLAPVEPLCLHALVLASGAQHEARIDTSAAEAARRRIERVMVHTGRSPLEDFARLLDETAALDGHVAQRPARFTAEAAAHEAQR